MAVAVVTSGMEILQNRNGSQVPASRGQWCAVGIGSFSTDCLPYVNAWTRSELHGLNVSSHTIKGRDAAVHIPARRFGDHRTAVRDRHARLV